MRMEQLETKRSESVLRWAVPDDAPGIAEVHVASWQEAYRGILPDVFLSRLDRTSRARWWHHYITEGARVHVVENDGVIVGFCSAGDSNDVGWGEVFSIYVHPVRWGEGHGRDLLAGVEEQLAGDGHARVLLWVLEDNSRGRSFYERQGWRLAKPFRLEQIGGVQVTELRYEKDLPASS